MCLPPISTTVPSSSTILTPSRLLVVTPYFRQCAPPEFMAMLPAIVQDNWLGRARAGPLARRVGGVEEPFGGNRLADRQVGDAGLHARGAALEIHLKDAVHL